MLSSRSPSTPHEESLCRRRNHRDPESQQLQRLDDLIPGRTSSESPPTSATSESWVEICRSLDVLTRGGCESTHRLRAQSFASIPTNAIGESRPRLRILNRRSVYLARTGLSAA